MFPFTSKYALVYKCVCIYTQNLTPTCSRESKGETGMPLRYSSKYNFYKEESDNIYQNYKYTQPLVQPTQLPGVYPTDDPHTAEISQVQGYSLQHCLQK